MDPQILTNPPPSATPTNGASNGASTTPPTPAQGNGGGELFEQIKTLLDSKLADHRNGIFADLRKAGALGKGTKEPEPQTQSQPPADDVQQLIARERAFNRAISTVKLNDTQFARMERSFQLEKPDDPAAWVKSWVADLGIGQEAAVHQPSNPANPRSAHPVSDTGAPAPVTTPSDEVEPWRLSADDVSSLLRRDGYQVAGQKLREQYRRALRGRRIRLK